MDPDVRIFSLIMILGVYVGSVTIISAFILEHVFIECYFNESDILLFLIFILILNGSQMITILQKQIDIFHIEQICNEKMIDQELKNIKHLNI